MVTCSIFLACIFLLNKLFDYCLFCIIGLLPNPTKGRARKYASQERERNKERRAPNEI